jgi:hypothetical protein
MLGKLISRLAKEKDEAAKVTGAQALVDNPPEPED